ncbi:MAG: hypothetical protein K0R08_2207 [Solimicrobium sp.]|jgi:hemerythrin superfamily protein|nr:hypothetical protein [Solimicrobium sp.]
MNWKEKTLCLVPRFLADLYRYNPHTAAVEILKRLLTGIVNYNATTKYFCAPCPTDTARFKEQYIAIYKERTHMNTTANDAISLLIKDHREVKEMFKKYEGLTDRSIVSKKKLADQICQALTVHAEVEEQIFYPAVREAIKDDDLMDESLVEHAAAKELIAEIENMNPEEDLYDAKVTVLSEQIDHHVEEEEKEMFPQVQKAGLDLVELGKKMKALKKELEIDVS